MHSRLLIAGTKALLRPLLIIHVERAMIKLDASAVRLHVRMLNDRARTEKYLEAIADVVQPGDVVVDVGTGTGVLALAAARAGARRVFAIEAAPIRRVAQELFEVNGYAERITLVSGDSTEVEIPERADILITETFGNGAFTEGVLPLTVDARNRLLKPNARVIPQSVRLWGIPVAVPDAVRERFIFGATELELWKTWYEIDFSPLRNVNRHLLLAHSVELTTLLSWRRLSDPVLLGDVDLRTNSDNTSFSAAKATISAPGTLSGVILFFELQLTPRLMLTTEPGVARLDNHWLNPVYFLPEPIVVKEGMIADIVYRYLSAENEDHLALTIRNV